MTMSEKDEKLAPVHPGEVLLEEFLQPLGFSQNRLALDIRVPARRINEIVHGRRRVTPDTALRLARYFNMSAAFWLGLQMDYDMDTAETELDDVRQQVVALEGRVAPGAPVSSQEYSYRSAATRMGKFLSAGPMRG